MPRKVLITKDTLEEILAKYQGGGSSGGSGKLYEYKFDLKVYDNGADPEYHLSFLLYESNFERLKQIAAQQNITLNSPQDIVTFINSLDQTTTQIDPTYVSQFILFGALVDKVLNTDRDIFEELVADVFVGGFYGPEGQVPRISLVNDVTEPATYYGLNTNNSCTLTEYGTSSDGQSGGSGTSDVLYKHTITGLVAEPDTPETDPEQLTLTFLSKHANSFASNSSLVDFGANILNTDDANAIISPMIVGDSGGINVTVYPVVANGSLSQIRIFFPYSTSGNFYYQVTASRNTSGITDTVEPYIQVSGGSGSSESGSSVTRLTIAAQETNEGFERKFFLWFACSESELYALLNQGFTMINTQFGMQILNTNCSTTTDIANNLSALQQIDTTGGSAPDNNELVYTMIVLLSTMKECFKVTAPYTAEFNTDLNSMDLIRGPGKFCYVTLANGNGVISIYDFTPVIGLTTVSYTCEIDNL